MVAVALWTPLAWAVENPYGICAHISRPHQEFSTRVEELTIMKEMGIGWCRTDFDWSLVEPKQGEWRFDHLDALMDDAARFGIQMLPILDYEVSWANRPWSDAHISAWRVYVRTMVTRYRGRCPVWEVWNEPNCTQSGLHPSPKPQEYARILKAAYEEIKAADPSARVSICGFGGVPLEYIEDVYKAGGAPYFDIMNVHPYQSTDKAEGKMEMRYGQLRALMAKYGDAEKPVWATEIGLDTYPSRLTVPGFLRDALANVDASRRWRVLYTDYEPSFLDTARRLLADELTQLGATLDTCLFRDLEARLAGSGVDALVLPYSEAYPAEAMEAVCDFVKAGGTMVDFGGMALFKPVRWKGLSCHVVGGGNADRQKYAQKLRFGCEFWCSNTNIPKRFASYPTAAFRAQRRGKVSDEVCPWGETRCFRPVGLKEGDAFIPLLVCETNGYTCVSMARIKYGSDFKGNVILGGYFERAFANDDVWQGKGCARQLNMGYAMGYEKLFWYELQQCSDFGIVRRKTFAPREAYHAFRAFIDMRPAGSVNAIGAWRSADDDLYHPQWTRPDGRVAGSVWSVSGRGRPPSFAQGAAEYRDWLGRRISSLPSPLPDTPVYYLK